MPKYPVKVFDCTSPTDYDHTDARGIRLAYACVTLCDGLLLFQPAIRRRPLTPNYGTAKVVRKKPNLKGETASEAIINRCNKRWTKVLKYVPPASR